MILAGGITFINLKNVEYIKERADLARAFAVEDMCDKFIRLNYGLLQTDCVPAAIPS